ncbi:MULTISPECIES: hypothetical protein [Haloferax]|uniref:hypothetical protein n=1 Tax=Haloferax TaxID=2251 RepID=UPI00177D6AB8|nr:MULTISPECIES: hypothetical protein [Haloferax]
MNRATALATGVASGYGISMAVAMVVFFGEPSATVGVAAGFALVTVVATFVVTRFVVS